MDKCRVTRNECGTDTWPAGCPCTCDRCQAWLCAELLRLQEQRDEARADTDQLREMLAYCYAGALLYRDDGELQDNATLPFIDFRRDSVADIEAKMLSRAAAAIRALSSAAEGGERG